MPVSMDPSSSYAGSTGFRRLRRRIIAVGILIIFAFASSSAYDAWRSYRQTIRQTDRELSNLAKALAAQGARSLQTIDVLLRDTAHWYADAGRMLAPEAVNEVLANRAAGLAQVRALRIIDAQGVRRFQSRPLPEDNANASDRSYFIAHRDGTATGLFISEPILARSENRLTFFLSRRLEDQGRFAGIVNATVDLEDVQQFYRAIDLGAGSAIHLLRDDGTLIVRDPQVPDAVGQKFPELASAAGEPARVVLNTVDRAPRFVAVAHMRELPLVVTVTRKQAVALQPWRDEAIPLAVRTLVLTLLGALTIAALLHQLRRIQTGEQALRKSEERYALAMDAANEGYWDVDLTTDRLFLSPKMKMLHGRSGTTPVTTRTDWLARVDLHPDDAPRLDPAVKDHLEGRTPQYELEYRVRHPDGEWHWILARGRCLRDAAGKPYRFIVSAMDVTARKQAEAEKERLEAQLRQSQKMEAVGTLAGGIAHDFNNILGAILGYGELAHKHSAEGSAARRYLDNVMHAAGRAKALVERILGFSRSGLSERAPVNVQSVIEETLELLAASLPPGVRLETKLDSGTAAVIGDSTQLHQVAMNLCTNAVQAMEHGGVLTLVLDRVEVREPRSLSQGALSPRLYVRLTVSDTGTGIPRAVLEQMFDPFFTTKAVGEGTGLGLSLVHGIVADMGGAIDVSTEVGVGTRFAIWLPVAGESAKPASEVAPELPRGHGETVMIVDDERPLVALAEEMLADLSYEPVGYDSSIAALQAFRADPKRYDLVLTDETMPDLVGTDLAREIRRLRPDIPIVLMSGYPGAQLAERAGAAGITEVLRKPLMSRDIAESLARVLGSAR